MHMRRLLTLLALLLSTPALALVANFGPSPVVTGVPGEYATFAVPFEGDGQFTVTASAPEGWQLVSDSREVSVNGSTLVPFTIRVPSDALAGTSATVDLSATGVEGFLTRSHLTITVAGSSGVSLAGDEGITADPGGSLTFDIRISNDGNQRDVIDVSATTPSHPVNVSPAQLVLEPFASGTVTVTVPFDSNIRSGYRLRVSITATSRQAGTSSTRDFQAVYSDPDEGRSRNAGPELVLRIRAAVGAGLESEDGETRGIFVWSLTPGLSGALSDFVDVDVAVGSFRNSDTRAFIAPQTTDISLTAENWDAAISFGPGRYGLRGGFTAGHWRFSVGSRYAMLVDQSVIALEAGAVSQNPALDLQLYGNVIVAGPVHSESVSATWRRQLTENLNLGLGIGVGGGVGVGGGDYEASFTFTESLQWLTQNFDMRQSLSSSPGSGQHTISLDGGTRTSGLLGIRFLSRLNITPVGSQLSSSVRLISRPVPALQLSAGVGHVTHDFGDGPSTVSVQLGVDYRFSFRSGLQAGIGTGVELIAALNDQGRGGTGFRVDLNTVFRQFTVSVRYRSRTLEASATEPAGHLSELTAQAGWTFGSGSLLSALWELENNSARGSDSIFSVRWEQHWNPNLETVASWKLRNGNHEFAIGVTASDVLTRGLDLGLSYGLTTAAGHVTHRLVAGIAYTWEIPFSTPRPVQNIFGGRETGGVSGVAFSDTNVNGVHDFGEPPLAGVTVSADGISTTTAADGSYTLRLPAGRHELQFTGGLPATFGFTGDPAVDVHLNSTFPLDLAFAPISVVRVSVFLDGDRDGQRDADEPLLPGVSVSLSGPRERNFRTGPEGSYWATALVRGSYLLGVDLSSLPAGHVLTQEPAPVTVEPPANPQPVFIGVAPMVREVVTTFTAGGLVVNSWLSSSSALPGTELTIMARVQGDVSSVEAQILGQTIALQPAGDMWSATFQVPESKGLARGLVVATGPDGSRAEAGISLLVQ